MRPEDQGLAFEYLPDERIIVLRHGDAATEEQWETYLSFLGTLLTVDGLRILGYADGSPPPAAVQRRIGTVTRGRSWQIALISESPAFRFAVSAFALLNRNVRGFQPSDMDEAFRHLGCQPAERKAVLAVLERLRNASAR